MTLNQELEADPAIVKWLSYYPSSGQLNLLYKFGRFYRFLQGVERFQGLSPSQLIEFQSNAEKKEHYVLLDALQDYIKSLNGTFKSLTTEYASCKSFFKKNRAALPDDDFKINAKKPPNQGRLDVDTIKIIVNHAALGRKAFYLTVWMSLMDLERFSLFNKKCGGALVEHLQKRGVDEPFLFEYPGRKQSGNKQFYYTFVGRDALAAWKEYFEHSRGWPKDGEAIYVDNRGNPCSKNNLWMNHLRLLEKLKYIKRGGECSKRYGYNLHEFRDVARTLLHLSGRGDNLDLEAVEFWMGHTTDPNKYDKFYEDKAYVLEQYRIAEKYLNLISGTSGSENHTAELEKRLTQYQNVAAEALTRLGNLEAIVERIKKLEEKEKIKAA